ncbi:tRNA-splicing endonuclease subunit Sen2 [Bombus pascuorum]|uniref:tRNA-splicing endonuclease subunit Sen2 n=1 Tax=Bombus pascuorum TaxID=65598 RepID=UPI00213A2EBE|nr:tRNA-splicing endonuclease subunit Sen2 [Bombus pascuorum]
MNLREPKKKRRMKLTEQLPLPIVIGNQDEWTTYTAHLTDLGSCIIDPNEIVAVHSMGFFGKGSLSRGFPSFGKTQYGAPPVIRNRQWLRRQEWLKQFNELSMEPNSTQTNPEENKCEIIVINSYSRSPNDDDVELLSVKISPTKQNTPDIIEIDTNSAHLDEKHKKNQQTDEELKVDGTISNSTKEDDALIIIENKSNKKGNNIDNNQKGSIENEEKSPSSFSLKENDICFTENNLDVQNKLLVLPDSDSETENYLQKIKPKIECENFPIQETLHLTFEETFFLLYGLGCLNLIDFDGNLLDIDSAWHIFCKTDKNFISKYVVYHYFRSKGWVVKPGLKYGGDFLLYKQGPPFYHASYIVIIDTLDSDTLVTNQDKRMHKLTWNSLLGLERLSETAAKEILFAQVLWPSSTLQTSDSLNVDMLPEFSVRELLWRRWNPKHKDIEEEDDDSY